MHLSSNLLLLVSSLLLGSHAVRAEAQAVFDTKNPNAGPGPGWGFDPKEYERLYEKNVKCTALNRNGGKDAIDPKKVEINLRYIHVPAPASTTKPRTLLMVHGWPGLWTSWSGQIQHFHSLGYNLVIPDIRGFGKSTHPGDVQASGTMGDIVGDLMCILDGLNKTVKSEDQVEKLVCVGHDWGAQVCWEAARMRPDVVEGVVGAVVPYLPSAGPFTPVEHLSKALPHLSYQIYFEKDTTNAVKELNQDIRRSLRSVYRSVLSPPPSTFLTSKSMFLKAWNKVTGGSKDGKAVGGAIQESPFWSKAEEDYLVGEFSRQGFDNTLQFYTYGNRYGSWDLNHNIQKNHTIPQPALYIVPVSDPVADWPLAALILQSSKFFTSSKHASSATSPSAAANAPNRLVTKALNTAHWPQLEAPVEFNDILEDWLDDLDVYLGEIDVSERMKDLEVAREKLGTARESKRSKEWEKWVGSAKDRIEESLLKQVRIEIKGVKPKSGKKDEL